MGRVGWASLKATRTASVRHWQKLPVQNKSLHVKQFKLSSHKTQQTTNQGQTQPQSETETINNTRNGKTVLQTNHSHSITKHDRIFHAAKNERNTFKLGKWAWNKLGFLMKMLWSLAKVCLKSSLFVRRQPAVSEDLSEAPYLHFFRSNAFFVDSISFLS